MFFFAYHICNVIRTSGPAQGSNSFADFVITIIDFAVGGLRPVINSLLFLLASGRWKVLSRPLVDSTVSGDKDEPARHLRPITCAHWLQVVGYWLK